ncbi:MAG: N-acetylmuramic acid 6-phosphate etherase [Calditrichaeota bacterium]|nr:MAG: N-acetylmuramic acid 6-phosphate etherase [Calditrichota bacterium]
MDRGKLLTESRNPNSMNIDSASSLEIAKIINEEDKLVPLAIEKELENIAKAIDLVVETFENGGRLFYVGAGTSGRLGVLDASECPPTFGVERELVQGIIAGGEKALTRSIEGAEDFEKDGAKAILGKNVSAKDTIFGIAAGSTTPYVLGALKKGKKLGCKTIFFSCNSEAKNLVSVDVYILPQVGPEVVTGSTRMKAGTATKLVLNSVTTGTMIKIGKVYENLMVDLKPLNVKLVDRSNRILRQALSIEADEAKNLIATSKGNLKIAILIKKLGIGFTEAKELLSDYRGNVRVILQQKL